jgi:N-acyl-D-aspartate/D-glutamate deacylase
MDMPEENDILIKNASIVDGTGAPAYKGAVAVKGDRITAVGKVEGDLKVDAETVIDARGLTVAPGFIDVHNHGDLSILYYPEAEGFVRQGITTFVGGNCGDSPGPFGEYIGLPWVLRDLYTDLRPRMYDSEWLIPREALNSRHREIYGWEIDWNTLGEFFKRVEAEGLSPNYAPLVGHGDVRGLVMGPDYKRKAIRREVSEMRRHVEKAMEDGCIGISVGRDYDPGIWADFDEILACARIAAKHGGVYASHSLRTGHRKARRPGEFPPVKTHGVLEAINIGRKVNMPIQVSHLGSLYDVRPGGSEIMNEAAVKATLKLIDDAREEGIDVSFDEIPNHLTGGISTTPWLVSSLVPWLRVAGGLEQLAKALRMEDFREEIKEVIMSGKWYGLNPNIDENWAKGRTIVECEDERFLEKTVADIAEELGVEPLDALMEVLMADPGTKAVRKGGDDKVKLMFYRHPEAMIGIDTFAVDEKMISRHPPWSMPNENSYGGFPRYLRRAVRETGTLSLEEAISKVTSLPARKFRLRDRGVLKDGACADIVVLDPETVTDKGDQLNPRRYPEGIEHVIVNGTIVVKNSKHTGARPGRILYRET